MDENRPDLLGDVSLQSFKPWWQTLWGMTAIALAIFGTCFGSCFLSPISYVRGDTDIFGNYRFARELDQERDQQEGLELVHAQLFPSWLIATSRGGNAQWEEAARERYASLEEALEDEKLLAILGEIQELVYGEAPGAEEATRFKELLGTWNRRVSELGEPYFVTGSLVRQRESAFWVCEFYRELYGAGVMVDSVPVTIRIAERADSTNIQESYLGVAQKGADDALVVVDRILDFVVDNLWPLFEEGSEEGGDPVTAAFAEAVRAEALAGLGREHYDALAGSAPWRSQLTETASSIHERHKCGHRFRLIEIPWNGYNPRALDDFSAMARMDRLEQCERLTFREADALSEASRALQRDPRIQAALEALVAWVTRGVAIHEARHIADDVLYNGLEEALLCDECGRLSVSARAELSAYLASMAWGDNPATVLYQACVGGRSSGAHRSAIGRMNRLLDQSCDASPGGTLGDDARVLEERLFRRSESVELPESYPERIAIRRFR